MKSIDERIIETLEISRKEFDEQIHRMMYVHGIEGFVPQMLQSGILQQLITFNALVKELSGGEENEVWIERGRNAVRAVSIAMLSQGYSTEAEALLNITGINMQV